MITQLVRLSITLKKCSLSLQKIDHSHNATAINQQNYLYLALTLFLVRLIATDLVEFKCLNRFPITDCYLRLKAVSYDASKFLLKIKVEICTVFAYFVSYRKYLANIGRLFSVCVINGSSVKAELK